LPTLIHTRSANAKWLYEISHKNPLWMNPEDAHRIGVHSGDNVRIDTEIGYFVDSVWVTEGIKPGVVAVSHHLGRFRFEENAGVNRGASNLVKIEDDGKGGFKLRVIHGATAWESSDPDTSRIWWSEVGVTQNLTHAVHPDPVSGVHCWLQKVTLRKATADEHAGDVFVDTNCSMEKYREWLAMTRPANQFSPDGTRRPFWLARPLKPVKDAYKLPK
jgi:anaerobic selenocysteine-containing dehydrogenase